MAGNYKAFIGYVETSAPTPGKLRELMRDGRWLVPPSERPADWREREQARHDHSPPRDIGPATSRRDSLRSDGKRAPSSTGRSVGRPRTRPLSEKRPAWNRKQATDEEVSALRAQGLSYAAIAKQLGFTPSGICRRLKAVDKKKEAKHA